MKTVDCYKYYVTGEISLKSHVAFPNVHIFCITMALKNSRNEIKYRNNFSIKDFLFIKAIIKTIIKINLHFQILCIVV